MKRREKSEDLFAVAKKHLVGGVNSPVRAYSGLDFAPPFIERAGGAYIWDVDGNKYIDYVGSFGPAILGHAHPAIVKAVKMAAEKGTSYGAPTEAETELAKLVKEAFPSIDLIRFVSSGTEAAMSAIRAARGFTKRDKIIKFNGCYHGHSDHLLVRAGSGAASFSLPDSAGVPENFAGHTLVAEYNDLDSVNDLMSKYPGEIAAIIVEPVAGNMGCIPPEPGFLAGLRKIADDNGIMLIFDEVITGFRVAFGGAQELYGVKPDITCLGKILGGGLPMGAYGGRRDIMETVSPLGPVYQAGTLSGNPLAVAAGIATLEILRVKSSPSLERLLPKFSLPLWEGVRGRGEGRATEKSPPPNLPTQGGGIVRNGYGIGVNENNYNRLNRIAVELTSGLGEVLTKKDISHTINRVGSMFSIFFTSETVKSYNDAIKSDRNVFNKYFTYMLDNGIYFAPSPYESAFLSTEHTEDDIDRTVELLSKFRLQ